MTLWEQIYQETEAELAAMRAADAYATPVVSPMPIEEYLSRPHKLARRRGQGPS